jgi:hypothetical protein
LKQAVAELKAGELAARQGEVDDSCLQNLKVGSNLGRYILPKLSAYPQQNSCCVHFYSSSCNIIPQEGSNLLSGHAFNPAKLAQRCDKPVKYNRWS